MVNRYNIRKYRIVSIWPIEILLIEIIAYPTFFRIVGRFIERNSTIRTFVFFSHCKHISLHTISIPQKGARHNPPDDGCMAAAETIPATPPGWSWEPPTERSA